MCLKTLKTIQCTENNPKIQDENMTGSSHQPSLVPHLSYLLSGFARGVDESGVGNVPRRARQRRPDGFRTVRVKPPIVFPLPVFFRNIPGPIGS